MNKVFSDIWNALQGKKPHYAEFLERVTIRNIRGIAELTVPFTYPVSVLAGENCCGKSTVLYALACAYRVPDANPRAFAPAAMFPNFRPFANGESSFDQQKESVEIEYQYQTAGDTKRMCWRRGNVWGRSFLGQKDGKPLPRLLYVWKHNFFGQKGGAQPIRPVYIRTLSSVGMRSHLMFAQHPDLHSEEVDSSLVYFAEQILPFCYKRLVRLRTRLKRPLLFAEIASEDGKAGSGYSEFDMSSGERAVLELSLALSKLKGALVLLDEVDMGLHPRTQQKLMLELQRLALRNDLQIIATTHSPTILDCVPDAARLFLERKPDGASLRPAYRDIIQNALYGRSRDILSVLCEDIVAENLIRGVLDVLCPEMGFRHSDVKIGRDTGADEFGHHFRMLKKFGLAEEFLFVLDGDEAGRKKAKELLDEKGGLVGVLNLPGEAEPEEWVWGALRRNAALYAREFGMDESVYVKMLRDKEQMYDGTVGNVAKDRLKSFCDEIGRETQSGSGERVKDAIAHVARVVGRRETETDKGEMEVFKMELKDAISAWRRE